MSNTQKNDTNEMTVASGFSEIANMSFLAEAMNDECAGLEFTLDRVKIPSGGMTAFGLGLYVFQKTGSATDMALLTFLGYVPCLLLSAPAGVLADKYDRRLLMMLGDGLSGLGVLFILLCMLKGDAALWQIYLGTTISSVFSALLGPAYTATITDLLTKEQYSKANGLMSMAGSARYLFSPVLAAAIVKHGIKNTVLPDREPFLRSMKEGWAVIKGKRGLLTLMVVTSLITLFVGFFQILAEPFVLAFSDAKTLGLVETVSASGMLATGILLGIIGIKKHFVRSLWMGLAVAGVGMLLFGATPITHLICAFGFLFFAALPFANNSLDYLVRTNIPDELQGRAWGLISVISNLGYIVALIMSRIKGIRELEKSALASS